MGRIAEVGVSAKGGPYRMIWRPTHLNCEAISCGVLLWSKSRAVGTSTKTLKLHVLYMYPYFCESRKYGLSEPISKFYSGLKVPGFRLQLVKNLEEYRDISRNF